MNNDLLNYLDDYINKPWGKLFYQIVWAQLSFIKNVKVLDFGSGFGVTANHLAASNLVTAIEPNIDMVILRFKDNNYNQINGGYEQLKQFDDNSFDVIICHNVFEYVNNKEDIFNEFTRLLKSDGIISIIKHNHMGRIMQKVVFENKIDYAISLLDGGSINTSNFGKINYYDINDLLIDSKNIKINNIYGIRVFFGLQQNNDIKYNQEWQDKMFEIEMKVSTLPDYIKISFFNHYLLKKVI